MMSDSVQFYTDVALMTKTQQGITGPQRTKPEEWLKSLPYQGSGNPTAGSQEIIYYIGGQQSVKHKLLFFF